MSFGEPRVEAHDAVLGAPRAGDDREPEHEERVREQRAENRRLRDDDLACAQREDHDEELRQVAERRLQHAGRRPGRSARRPSPCRHRPSTRGARARRSRRRTAARRSRRRSAALRASQRPRTTRRSRSTSSSRAETIVRPWPTGTPSASSRSPSPRSRRHLGTGRVQRPRQGLRLGGTRARRRRARRPRRPRGEAADPRLEPGRLLHEPALQRASRPSRSESRRSSARSSANGSRTPGSSRRRRSSPPRMSRERS